MSTAGIVRVVPASSIRPSTYNPRTADPERLQLVALSLRKLGWLLPIYADAAGEILSGHQRHYVATEMLGLEELPVVHTKAMTLAQRKAINIAFNRGTNDMTSYTLTGTLKDEIQKSGVIDLAAALPDVTGSMPILDTRTEPIGPILSANKGNWTRHAANVSRILIHRGVEMPVIVDENDRIVNGIGRLERYASIGRTEIAVLRIPNRIAPVARSMLNLLTMDFDLHRRYADELRYNSFRRMFTQRKMLGIGFTFATVSSSHRTRFDITNPTHASAWRKVHGQTVLDFGAGHLYETRLLREAGFDVTAFEPYRCRPDGTVDKDESMHLTDAFLAAVPTTDWSSIFISSVLNSVPFKSDRQHLVTLLSALAHPVAGSAADPATVYAVALSTANTNWKNAAADKPALNERDGDRAGFRLDHEEGTVLSDFLEKPKVQKYHTMPEFQALFRAGFGGVQTTHVGSNCQGTFTRPRPVDPARLAAAIDFEFELPYPDGTTMGRSAQARAAFGRRLGIDLSR